MKRIKSRLLKGKQFYAAILICVLAVGAGAFSALRASAPAASENAGEVSRVTIVWEEESETSAAQVNDAVSGIFGSRTTEKAETPSSETQTTEKKSSYMLPLGTDIIKDFSDGKPVASATMGDWRVHNGVDFGGAAGSKAVSVADGTVSAVYQDSFWGTVVEIDIGEATTARYCGLSEDTPLKKGDSVVRGDTIGTLGAIPIESADESHLHFEILSDGKCVDPLEALGKTGSGVN